MIDDFFKLGVQFFNAITFSITVQMLFYSSRLTQSSSRIYPRFLSTTLPTDSKKEEQEGLYLRSKRFLKAYGLVGVATYWGLWSGVFGGFYFSFKTGMMDYESWQWLHMDLLEGYYIKSLTWVGIDPDDHPVTPETKDILVAMAAAKVLKPIEFLAAVAITPPLARTLGLAPSKKTNNK